MKANWLGRAGQIETLDLPDLKTCPREQSNRIAIEIAAAREHIPDRVKAILPTYDGCAVSLAMFAKYQPAVRLEDTANFTQRLLRIRDRTKRVGQHRGIRDTIIERDIFRRSLDQLQRHLCIAAAFLAKRQEALTGIDANYRSTFAGS